MKRLPTAIPGLDAILNGGLFEGGVYILEGPPGVGKTTMANQIAYTQAARGAKTLYVTMLAESHSRMLQHLEGQKFFQRESVNAQVFYISGYRELEQTGLRGLVSLLRGEIVRHGASLLVVDGLVVDPRVGSSEEGVRPFVHELQSLVTAMECTCLLLTSSTGRGLSAEQTMVDGIFSFEDHAFQWRAERRLQIRKFRGSEVVRGKHTFCISENGLHVYPRFEAMPFRAGDWSERRKVSSGLAQIDAVLQGGGLVAGTSTLVVGQTGVGKTNIAAAFAAVCAAGHPGVMFTGTESPSELPFVAARMAPHLSKAVDGGWLQLALLNHGDESLDEMAHKILHAVDGCGAQRLAVDGLSSLADTLAFPERGYRFVGRLLAQLKARGVSSLFTIDPDGMAAATNSTIVMGVSAWFDNVFELSQDLTGPEARRTLLVKKLRGTHASTHVIDMSTPT